MRRRPVLAVVALKRRELLVPEDIWKAVAADPAYESPWQGDVLLRGKEERVAARGVTCAT